jgi:hypothetical protein
MVRKLSWEEPAESTITQIEINRSSSLYGTYTVIDTINATSDGEVKSSSNSWVTNYTDASGLKTHWYKIRFYDSTSELYSEYSDPTTSDEVLRLCTVDDVKSYIDTVGRWTDDEVFDAITHVDDMMYVEMGTPIKEIWSPVIKERDSSTIARTYYTGEENIYRIDRVFYGTTSQHEVFVDDEYKTNLKYGMIRFLPVASSGPTFTDNMTVTIRFVPKIYNLICTLRTCEHLLSKIDLMGGGEPSGELEVIQEKLAKAEQVLNHKITPLLSSEWVNYEPIYETNSFRINQNYDKNKIIGSYGWD